MMNNEQDLENKMENEEEKKACAECGEMIPADADYCPFCGKPVMKHLNVVSRPFTFSITKYLGRRARITFK